MTNLIQWSASFLLLAIGLIQPMAWCYAAPDTLKVEINEWHKIDDRGIVGVNFTITTNAYPIIQEVYPGTPAARAHLRPGDIVIAINSQNTMGMTVEQVDLAISDVPGDKIGFVVDRAGSVFLIDLVVESLDSVKSNQTRQLYSQMFN